MQTRLFFTGGQGLKLPYVCYDTVNSWQKVSADTVCTANTLTFNAAKTGKYVILLAQDAAGGVPDSCWAKENIDKFLSKYDLSDVFIGIDKSFAPEDTVSGKEMILLYEKLLDKSGESVGLDVRQKAMSLELDSIINYNNIMGNITRQEMAAILVRIYSVKLGVDSESLKTGKNIFIKDEVQVGGKYYKYVLLVIDRNMLTIDSNANFNPRSFMTCAQVITALVLLLEQTGDF